MECSREPLVDAIVRFLGHDDASVGDTRALIEREIDLAGADAVRAMSERLSRAGADWQYYPADPLARRIHQALAPRVLKADSTVYGIEHLFDADRKPTIICANHLSYSDANVIDVLLRRSGATLVADRLTAMAGPKVYSNITRRFSSLCFGTIKTPQNAGVASEEAAMTPREVAKAAKLVIQIARERLDAGEVLLVFPEGSRSRNAQLQPFLPGVARYFAKPDVWVTPMALTGTEALYPVGGQALASVTVSLTIGAPISGAELHQQSGGNRRAMVDIVGKAIAAMLPVEHRGHYC
jgi:1-acyl-sn-glycerol-3-phosphate acyltransferase